MWVGDSRANVTTDRTLIRPHPTPPPHQSQENETSDLEGEALKTDPCAYRKWVERIPVAGTKIIKGLSVADCFEG